MYRIIHESLSRQSKALAVLHDLLEEEYAALLARDTDGVVGLEFSVQELIRQLALEKYLVIRQLNGSKVLEYAALLPEEQASALRACFAAIDESEQRVSRQASRNAQLSLALLDQSSRNLQALASRAMPPQAETYGRKGGMKYQTHPQAALISGRL